MQFQIRPQFQLLLFSAMLFSPLVQTCYGQEDAARAQKAGKPSQDNEAQTVRNLAETPGQLSDAERQQKAEEQLQQQVRQRMLGIVPAFNATTTQNPVPLSPSQKFRLAFRSATDPWAFGIAGLDAGINQLQNDFPGYGQGFTGYLKRFGASYTDSFNGTMIGNAMLPVLLHQDPRYYRKGTGSFSNRLLYAITSTARCKGDNGRWQPNYSNLMGNFIAGGISNIYYPSSDRGAGLTVQRALTVTAEGALGAILYEFWPDISRKMARRHQHQ